MSRRWICVIVSHAYARHQYPGGNEPGSYVLRCRRCGHERDPLPRSVRGPMAGGLAL